MSEKPVDPPKVVVRSTEDDAARQLPKRFYKAATACAQDGGFAIELDGRAVRTPQRQVLLVPTMALGQAIADEWNALGDVIDPQFLPLTKIANTAADGVMGREQDVHDEVVRFIGNDLLFYRADNPQGLVDRQVGAWDPVLDWFRQTYDAEFRVTAGIMPIEQDIRSVAKAASALSGETAMSLGPLHVITTLTGSALLAIAHRHGHLSAEDIWQLSHIDEDWQIEQWGEDAEATERRQKRQAELNAASKFLSLLVR